MPRERKDARAQDPAINRVRQARGPTRGESLEEVRRRARARRAEVALVSSYLRALRRLGEMPIGPARPEMPN